MADSIAVDGAQQVRGADDERVSSVQSGQGFGNRVSSGSGGIAGTVLQHGGAAEDTWTVTIGPRVAAGEAVISNAMTGNKKKGKNKGRPKPRLPGNQRNEHG